MNSQQIIQKIKEAENEITIEPVKDNVKDFFINGKINFYIKESNGLTFIFIQFILISLVSFHTTLTLFIISSSQGDSINASIEKFQELLGFYRILFIFMVIQKLLLILSLYFRIKQQPPIVVISSILQQILNYYATFKQIDLAFTAFLSIINFQENFVFFIISSGIYMFHAIYLQNYTIRKELTYAASFFNNILFRFLIVTNYLLNLIFIQIDSFFAFNCLYSIVAVLVFIWYHKIGHKLFYHSLVRRLFLVSVAMFQTSYVFCAQYLVANFDIQHPSSQITQQILIFLVFCFIFYMLESQYDHRFQKIHTIGAKDIDLSLSRLFQFSSNKTDLDAQLIGLIKFIQTQNNIQGELNFYDPLLRRQIKGEQKFHQRQSVLKRFIKNIYLQQIYSEEGGKDQQIYIDYCQFLCNYNPNYIEIHKYLSIAKEFSLHILQRIKIDRIETVLQESNAKLNLLIYDGSLKLEEIIDSENSYNYIQAKIKQYIESYISIWSLLKLQFISLLQFRFLLKKQFRVLEQINLRWKKIAKFFQINKKWSFIYIHYLYFIRNQKVKQKQSEIFKFMKLNNENIFGYHPIYLLPHAKESEIFNPLILYNDDTFCLMAKYQLGSLIIKDVNKKFEAIIGYTKQQILNSPIEAIMEEDLKATHQQKFDLWAQNGHISDQNSYKFKDTYIITKEFYKISSYKYFKSVYSSEDGLVFFCMIKMNLKSTKFSFQNTTTMNKLSITNDMQSNDNFATEDKVKSHFPTTRLNEHIEKNIFVKQQSLQPVKEFAEIKWFKLVSRFFLVIIISSIIILLNVTSDNGQNLTKYSNQFINYMSMYRYPVILATNYMKNFLNVGNQTKVSKQIQTATNNFLASANLELTKITIFDEELNPPNIYYPHYNYSFLQNESYSQIDIFYMMTSAISTLKAPVNQTSLQYQRFNSFLKPSYDNLMNTTKFILHKRFGQIFDGCINNQYLFIIAQLGIFIIFVSILFSCIHRFINKMRTILYILLDFNNSQIHSIHNYWKFQKEHFNILFLQFQELQSTAKILSSQNMIKKLSNIKIGKEKTSLNNRSKQINEDRQRKFFEFKLRAIIIIIMVVILLTCISIETNMIIQLHILKDFEEAGFFFLKYFPTGPLVTLGCMEKYYADRFPAQIPFLPSNYDDVLTTMFIFGNNNNYIGEVVDSTSPYYVKQKNYFFGNPCEFNPSILNSVGIDVSKCMSMSNGTFKDGLSSFLRYGQKLGSSCIYDKVNLTASQLDEFTLGGTLLSAYVLDAITTWVNQFATRVIALEDSNYIQSIIVIIVALLLHICINEFKMIEIIYRQYDFIRKVYLNLVPEKILIDEKVIKQKFIIAGLIRA